MQERHKARRSCPLLSAWLTSTTSVPLRSPALRFSLTRFCSTNQQERTHRLAPEIVRGKANRISPDRERRHRRPFQRRRPNLLPAELPARPHRRRLQPGLPGPRPMPPHDTAQRPSYPVNNPSGEAGQGADASSSSAQTAFAVTRSQGLAYTRTRLNRPHSRHILAQDKLL